MSELTAKYFRARRGCLDVPELSDTARLLLAWLYQSESREVTPGLCRLGPGALGEEIGWTVKKVRRFLKELEGLVLVDEGVRVMFIVGAVRQDPPRTVNQIVAIARQFLQIPRNKVVAVAASEIDAAIKNHDKSLQNKWRELNCYADDWHNGSGNSRSPIPVPSPIQKPTSKPALSAYEPRALSDSMFSLTEEEFASEAKKAESTFLQKLFDRTASRKHRGGGFIRLGEAS